LFTHATIVADNSGTRGGIPRTEGRSVPRLVQIQHFALAAWAFLAIQIAISGPSMAQDFSDEFGSASRVEWSPYRRSSRPSASQDSDRGSSLKRQRSDVARSIDPRPSVDDDQGELPIVIGTLTPAYDDRDVPPLRRSPSRVARSMAPPSTVDLGTQPVGTVLAAPQYSSYPSFGNPQAGYFDAPIMQPACGPTSYEPSCRTPYRSIYARSEYLLWWLKGSNTPPLVTTSPLGTPAMQAGVLNQPGTAILVGDQDLNTGARSGGRITVGGWFNQTTGLEAEYFLLGNSSQTFDLASTGNPILARPFFNVQTGLEAAQILAFPGLPFQSTISVTSTSSFQGASIYLMRNIFSDVPNADRGFRVDFLGGYSYLNLHEKLTIGDSLIINTRVAPGATISRFDEFKTSNNFNGADLGMQGEFHFRRLSLNTTGRLGLGAMSETVSINGNSTVFALNTPPANFAGGFLALPTNIGSYHRSVFALVPRVGVKLGYNILPRLKVHVGYDMIYCNKVVRPGDQIDLALNTSQALGHPLVGQPRPAFTFHGSDLWAQGLDVGAELRF
jgi:hypothetical protein